MGIRTVNDIKIMIVDSKIDASSAKETENLLIGLVEEGNKKIICDFSQTDYVSSAGLRVFLLAAKRVKQVSGKLILFSLKERVLEVFETAGLVKLFQISSSEEEALKDAT